MPGSGRRFVLSAIALPLLFLARLSRAAMIKTRFAGGGLN